MRLQVGVFRAEEFLGAIDGELLDLVGVLSAAVVPFSRITFGVFVREDGAHGFEDCFGNEVFRRNEFEASGLAPGFIAQEAGDLRIDGVEWAIHPVVGIGGLTHRDSSFAWSISRPGVGSEGILSDGVLESQFRDS